MVSSEHDRCCCRVVFDFAHALCLPELEKEDSESVNLGRTCLIQGQLRQTGKWPGNFGILTKTYPSSPSNPCRKSARMLRVVGLLEDDGAKAEAVPATLVQQTSQSSLQASFRLGSQCVLPSTYLKSHVNMMQYDAIAKDFDRHLAVRSLYQ